MTHPSWCQRITVSPLCFTKFTQYTSFMKYIHCQPLSLFIYNVFLMLQKRSSYAVYNFSSIKHYKGPDDGSQSRNV